MASKKRRVRVARRERRKAKESGWTRLPKAEGRVGHGSGITVSVVKQRSNARKLRSSPRTTEVFTTSIGEHLRGLPTRD